MTRFTLRQCSVSRNCPSEMVANAATRGSPLAGSGAQPTTRRSCPAATAANSFSATGSTSSMVTGGTKPTAPPALDTSVQQATICARSFSVSSGSTVNSSVIDQVCMNLPHVACNFILRDPRPGIQEPPAPLREGHRLRVLAPVRVRSVELAHHLVARVALDRREAGVTDQVQQALAGHLVRGAEVVRVVRDLVLDHRAVQVVHAVVERELSGRQTMHHPEALDVVEVV